MEGNTREMNGVDGTWLPHALHDYFMLKPLTSHGSEGTTFLFFVSHVLV